MGKKPKQAKNAKSSNSSETRQQKDARRFLEATQARRSSQELSAAPADSRNVPDQTALDDYYLDVSAVRIQTWLDRTPKLTQRRGASCLLEAATSPEAVEKLVGAMNEAYPDVEGLAVNSQAGDISGVVNMRFKAPDDDTARGQALGLAAFAATHLRLQVPMVPLQGWYARGDTYLKAYKAGHRALGGGTILDLPVVPSDLPVTRPCESCGLAAAVVGIKFGDEEPKRMCHDCSLRAGAAGANHSPVRVPPSSRVLLKLLRARPGLQGVSGFPTDFEALAETGREADDNAPTQLATVFADGNRVGRLLADLADKETAPAGTDEVVGLLDLVTKHAVATAVAGLLDGATRPLLWETAPVMLHLAGGDDVLATVPAPLGWVFACLLGDAFDDLAETKRSQWPGVSDVPPSEKSLKRILGAAPSISSAIVFHHCKAPFADVVQRADNLLVEVKRSNHGNAAAIGFLDLGDDGEKLVGETGAAAGLDPTFASRCLPVAALPRSVLDALAGVPSSQRQTLLDLLRQHPVPADRGAWRDTIAHRVRTMACPAVAHSILGIYPPRATDSVEGAALLVAGDSGLGESARGRLRRDLDITRWWRSGDQLKALKGFHHD